MRASVSAALVGLVILHSFGCNSSSPSEPEDATPDATHRPDGAVEAGRDAPRDTALDTEPDSFRDTGRVGDASPCVRSFAAADRARKIVVSHPFDSTGNAANDFEVLDLDETGKITVPNVHFELGPTTDGRIAFTPDGLVGILAEDDGTLGVFRFDASGSPVVVGKSFQGSFYATRVVMAPAGDHAYVLSDQTENNGGGIFTVAIACDGALTDQGLLVGENLPANVLPRDGGTAVVAAKSALGVPASTDAGDAADPEAVNDALLLSWPEASAVLSTVEAFGDDLAIVSDAVITASGRYLLLGDTAGSPAFRTAWPS